MNLPDRSHPTTDSLDSSSTDPDATVRGYLQTVQSGRRTGIDAPEDQTLNDRVKTKADTNRSDSDEPFEPQRWEGDDRRESLVGTMVGNYRIESEIGSGGMGTVYLATQLKPVRREVALKMIRRGLDDDETLRRFHSERQALAIMDHPGIAKIYQADTTSFGNPYFAMEFCRGLPIRAFCKEHRLSIQQRIGLVIQLSRAVQSAHRLGVIHRDLKPDNVLVSLREGQPELKIIDFGIAKFTDESWHGDESATRTGQLVGTPAYMSPEQASGDMIDARTDVFAIGAILFELLTGTTPLLPPENDCDTIASIINYVLSYDSILPSHRLGSLETDNLKEIVEEVGLSERQLKSAVRGDLDWVCLKAIEKVRTDRYATCDDFADDLQRVLDHEAVTVAQSSLGYRAKKFYQRRKQSILITTAVCTILLCVAVFMGVSEWQRIGQTNQRIAQLKHAFITSIEQANESRSLAGSGSEQFNQHFAIALARSAKAKQILKEWQLIAESQDLQTAQVDLGNLTKNLEKDQAAADLIRELDDARERATQLSEASSDAFGKGAGIEKIKFALAGFGIQVGKTDPAKAAHQLGNVPAFAKLKIIEALDFLLNESPTGGGIYLHEQQGQVTIAELVSGGPAETSEQLRINDRVLKINHISLVDGIVSQSSGATLRSVAYRELFVPPGNPISVTVIREHFEPFTVRLTAMGHDNFWVRDVLAELDPDRWRGQLRDAVLNGDLATLDRLGSDQSMETQPAFSLIQLASMQFLFARSNDSIDHLRVCQRRYRKNFWANHYLGIALATTHVPPQPDEALRYLTAAVALRPNSLGARMNLASGFYYAGDLQGQLRELKDAHQIDPSYQPLAKQIEMLESALRANTNKSNDSDAEVFEESDQRVGIQFGSEQMDESSFEHWEAKAREQATAGSRKLAMATLEKASSKFPGEPRLRRAKGAVLLDLGDVIAARIVLAAAARSLPNDAATRFYHGVALQHEGRLEDALSEYRAAVKIQSNYEAAQAAVVSLESVLNE
ncbi:MAG: protein kinase [Planctomycetota bacterium]